MSERVSRFTRKRMVTEFSAGGTLDSVAFRSGTSRPVAMDFLRRDLPTATYLSESERQHALTRLTAAEREVIVGLLKKTVKGLGLDAKAEAEALHEVETAPDPAAAFEARLRALEPAKVDACTCLACGIFVQAIGFRLVSGVSICSHCAKLLRADSTLDDLRDFAVSRVLRLGSRLVGSGKALGVTLWSESGLTQPNPSPFAHLNPVELAAKFDTRYGQPSGPTVMQVRRPTGETTSSRSEHYIYHGIPVLGPPEVVVLDPDTAITFARGPRPLTPAERESAERRSLIEGKRSQRRFRVIRPREGKAERVAARAALRQPARVG